ncbi:MAG: acyl carrier protein, partial [Acidobacteria bacterium]|nr:acyl carrier protein [Acidobacteriota bacterium]
MKGELRRLTARILGVAPARLPLDRSLLAAGLDSLTAAELAAAVESELGARLDLAA